MALDVDVLQQELQQIQQEREVVRTIQVSAPDRSPSTRF